MHTLQVRAAASLRHLMPTLLTCLMLPKTSRFRRRVGCLTALLSSRRFHRKVGRQAWLLLGKSKRRRSP